MDKVQPTFDMILLALQEQVEITNSAKEAYEREIKERNTMIKSLLDGGFPVRRVCRITGLSRNQVYKIGVGTE